MLPYDMVELSMLKTTRVGVFAQPGATDGYSKFKMTGVSIDYLIEPYNEEAAVDCTTFIISIKSNVQTRVWDDTAGMTSLYPNLDYVSLNGKAFMNLDRFRVHFVKRTRTYEDGNGNSTNGGQRRGYKRIKLSHLLKNGTGNWTALTDNDFPVTARLYAVTFNNNSGFDGENPQHSFNCLYSGHSY